jgi:hypothetical protein
MKENFAYYKLPVTVEKTDKQISEIIDIMVNSQISAKRDYGEWAKKQHGIKDRFNDWQSLIFTPDNSFYGSSAVKELYIQISEKLKRNSFNDSLQIHISNINKDPLSVKISPHRDMNRLAGANFSIYNTDNTSMKFFYDKRYGHGVYDKFPPLKERTMPGQDEIEETGCLNYDGDHLYLVNGFELHSVEYENNFINDYRITGAYSFNPLLKYIDCKNHYRSFFNI